MGALPSMQQLRYLVALAQQLNFTRAAEACFVGQSTLSAGNKELESVLGVALVERDRQSVALTPAGSEVVLRAQRLLAAAQDLLAFTAEAGLPLSGRLRLGVIPTIAPFVLPRAMPVLRARFPKMTITLREDVTANLLERLARRELDMALMALPYDTQELCVRVLYEDAFCLVGPAGEPSLKGRKVARSAAWSERLLLLEEGHCLRDHALQACGRSELASAEGLEATSLLTLVQMVESGMGLALLPAMAVDGGLLKSTGLVARPLAAPAPKRQIALVTRSTFAKMGEFELIARALAGMEARARSAV